MKKKKILLIILTKLTFIFNEDISLLTAKENSLKMEEIFSKKVISVYDFTRLPRFYFNGFGIYSSIVNDKLTITRNTVLFCLFTLNLGLYIVAEVAYFVKSSMNGKSNIFEKTYLMLCVGYLMIAVMKLYPLVIRISELIKLFDDMKIEHPKTISEQIDYRVRQFFKRSNCVILSYGLAMFIMVFCFCFSPLTMSLIKYIRFNEWKVDFTYSILYPINPYKRGFFEFFYISQNWAALSASIGIICVDTILCCAVQLICMHFNQLSRTLLNYYPKKIQTTTEKRLFVLLVEKHNIIAE